MNIPKEWLVIALGIAATLFFPGARETIMAILAKILNVPIPGPTPPPGPATQPGTDDVMRAWRVLHEYARANQAAEIEAKLADLLPELVSSPGARALKS